MAHAGFSSSLNGDFALVRGLAVDDKPSADDGRYAGSAALK